MLLSVINEEADGELAALCNFPGHICSLDFHALCDGSPSGGAAVAG